MELVRMIREGGIVMWPLILCSLLVWAVVFEKWWALLQFRRRSRKLHADAMALVEQKARTELQEAYRMIEPSMGAPYVSVIHGQDEEHTRRRLLETQLHLKRFMWVLATIASASPFIGLFGTVVGIIRSFDSMARSGKGGFSVVASGLSEALVATAAGIFVAVVALVFYNYFTNRISLIHLEYKNRLADFAERLRSS